MTSRGFRSDISWQSFEHVMTSHSGHEHQRVLRPPRDTFNDFSDDPTEMEPVHFTEGRHHVIEGCGDGAACCNWASLLRL